MSMRDLTVLFVLGALWGSAFLFLRIAVPEFGPFALMEVRVVLAAVILVPLVIARRQLPKVLTHWRAMVALGVLQYAIPFCLLAYAMQTLSAGYGSVINASAPLFAGVIARQWLGERLDATRMAGLVLGLTGVALLVWNKLVAAGDQDGFAVIASTMAALCYGAAAVLAKRYLAGVNSMAVAAGSITSAALVLLPFSILLWPPAIPSLAAWSIAAVLGVFCTAVAFILYFRLIESAGSSKAIAVTFVIPMFGVTFGTVFLDEGVTAPMIAGGIIVAAGIALATGLVAIRPLLRRARAFTTRTAIVLLTATALGDSSGVVHAAEIDTTVYLEANSVVHGRDGGWDRFSTVALSGEVELVPDHGLLATSLFAEYHVSNDSRVDGATFTGILLGHRRGNWDATGYWFVSRIPGAKSRQTVKTRLRRVLNAGQELGVEYSAHTDVTDAGELKLGYYRNFGARLSFKILAGVVLRDDAEPRGQISLSWRLR